MRPVLVAVPVKDEAERIGACLRALGRQTAPADRIVLVVNNTTDGSAAAARAVAATLPVVVEVIEHWFPPEAASAGAARRMAMEHAAALAGASGALLTTDADGTVPPDWIERNVLHLRDGADAVAGRAVIDPADERRLPEQLLLDDALECAYAAALDEMAARLCPVPWDPLPRHTEHSGASLAVTAGAYRQVGGMPAARIGEDRAFCAALVGAGLRLRHAPEIAVTVSGRTTGRAAGGMADTIQRRLRRPDLFIDDALEPATDRWRRLRGELDGPPRRVLASEVDAELAIARRLLREVVPPVLKSISG